MKKLNLSLLLIIALSVLFLSCGREDIPGASIEKISNPDKTFSIEDFEAIGLRKNKTYKVSDLPKATSAYYGLLKIKGTNHFDYADTPHFSKIGRMIASGKQVDKDFAIRLSYLIVGFFDEYLKNKPYNWTEEIVNNYNTAIKFK